MSSFLNEQAKQGVRRSDPKKNDSAVDAPAADDIAVDDIAVDNIAEVSSAKDNAAEDNAAEDDAAEDDAAEDDIYDEHQSIAGRLLDVCLIPFSVLLYPLDRLFQWLVTPHDEVNYLEENYQEDGEEHPQSDRLEAIRWSMAAAITGWFSGLKQLLWQLTGERRRELLYLLPAASMLTFFAFVFYQVVMNAEAIERKYRLGAREAIEAGNFPLAKTYFARFAESNRNLSRSDRLQWSMVLAQTGQTQRAEQILAELAPDNARGYPPAHRVRALDLLEQLRQSQDSLLLQRLRWHLEKGNDSSEPIVKAWAAYYLAVKNTDKAVEYLRQAAVTSPELLITLADILRSQNRTSEMLETLRSAQQQFQKSLDHDALDSTARIRLAGVLIRLDDYDAAEQVLQAGYSLQPDAAMRQALAGYYIVRYDQADRAATELQQRFHWLSKSLEVDPNHRPAFHRISELHTAAATPADLSVIKESLMDIVTSDQPTALSHLALSNFLYQEKKFTDAQWHVEQAYRLNPQFVSAINNLAWMLAHQDSPELDRALELAKTALEKSPDDPMVQDTYGTILLLREEHDEAITYFEKALRAPALGPELHRKLAICYRHIGRVDLASMHEEKAGRVMR